METRDLFEAPDDDPMRDDPTVAADELTAASSGPFATRFEIRGELGRGGMGQVVAAWDRRLEREVALKFLLGAEGRSSARFEREARAQARIDHPHVLPIYDTGVLDNRAFVAMRKVDGGTLLSVRESLGREALLRLFIQVAEATQAAHEMGIIHRDIKPSNVLVSFDEDGAGHAWLSDFGLARVSDDPGMTRSGATIGTPLYMPPEQVRGELELIDRRSDVYALGASFYTVLLGAAPFRSAGSGDVMMQILTTEPILPRQVDPDLDPDLEAILLKCLEKRRQDRYPSARELAADLRAFLEGRPVAARRAGLWYRIDKLVRRHRALTAVSAIAVLAVFGLSTMWLRTELENRHREDLERQLNLELAEIDGLVRVAEMLPLHDLRRELVVVEEGIKAMKGRLESLEGPLEGVVRAALGRAMLAIGEHETSVAELERALELGLDHSRLRFDLARALAHRYQAELRTLASISESEIRELARRRLDAGLGARLDDLLGGIDDPEVAPPPLLDAMLALVRDEYQRARESAKQAEGLQPWSSEPRRIAAMASLAAAERALGQGDEESFSRAIAEARSSIEDGLDIARSHPELHAIACRVEVVGAKAAMAFNRDPVALTAQAATACAAAGAVDSTSGLGSLEMSVLHSQLAQWHLQRAEPASGLLELAIAGAERAEAIEGGGADAPFALGTALNILAEIEMRSGRDPKELHDRGIAALSRAVEIDPSMASAAANLGNSWRGRAMWQLRQGDDPVLALEAASAALERGLAVSPELSILHHNLATVELIHAEYLRGIGGDFAEPLATATAGFEDAVAINPVLATSWSNLGVCWLRHTELVVGAGGDPRESLSKARDALEGALEARPGYASATANLAGVLGMLALHEHARGGAAEEPLAEAIALVEAQIVRAPEHLNSILNLGHLRLAESRLALVAGADPSAALSAAHAAFERLAELEPGFAAAPIFDIRVDLAEAIAARVSGADDAAALRRARRRLKRAEVSGPDLEAAIAHAELALIVGSADDLRDAAGLLDAAFEINPSYGEAKSMRGLLSIALGDEADGRERVEGARRLDPTHVLALDALELALGD